MESTLLKYNDNEFSKKAKSKIGNCEDFCVSLLGWHSKMALSSASLLVEMQGDNAYKLGAWYTITSFFRLIFLSKLMVVFWIAVANRYKIEILSNTDGSTELLFRKTALESDLHI